MSPAALKATPPVSRASWWPRAWGYALAPMSLGVLQGFIATPLPYLLSRAGVGVERIASLESVLQIPGFLYFLWSPLTDWKLRRRSWLWLASLAGTAGLLAALPAIGSGAMGAITVMLGCGLAAAWLVNSSAGGLLASTLASGGQARAAAWYQGGNLAAAAAGGGALLWLWTRGVPLVVVGVVAALMMMLPATLALGLPEAAPEAGDGARERLRSLAGGLKAMARCPRTRASALLLASPVGTGAALSLLPALAAGYGVGAQGVVWVNGVAGGLVLAAGSLLGGWAPAGWDRRWAYAGAGMANAAATLVLLLAPSADVYYAGTILYLLTTGACYARFMALVTEAAGSGAQGAGTRYSVMAAFGNLPITYMLWLEGRAFHHGGAHGLLLTDAMGNLGAFSLLAGVWFLGGRLHSSPRTS